MNKFLRIVSTLVVGIGLILLFVYLAYSNSVSKAQLLEHPSYYTLQNYWYLLLAGCGCVAFSIISSFLAWNKKLDEKVEILPNAVAAEKTDLLSWLTGSSLDTGSADKNRKTRNAAADTVKTASNDRTVRPQEAEPAAEHTECRTEADTEFASGAETVLTDRTAMSADDDRTVLADDSTVMDRG